MSLEALVGRTYGPFRFSVSATKVAEFVAATGDDPDRWAAEAPPGFAASALFTSAPAFFADEAVAPYLEVLIHSEQRFTWHGSMRIGTELSVLGEVQSVRARSGLNLVTFLVEAGDGASPVLTSTSVFLLAAAAASGDTAEERTEPTAHAKLRDDRPLPALLPAEGGELPALLKSASRLDLVRYAGATLDFNPIHWDHETARNAGVGGVIAHGLLMGSWMLQAAASVADRDSTPLREARLRFRRPLHPADQAVIAGSVSSVTPSVAELRLRLTAGDDEKVTATATVNRAVTE